MQDDRAEELQRIGDKAKKELKIEKIYTMYHLGITGHEDKYVVDGNYQDIVFLGPLRLVINIDKETVDNSDDPIKTRMFNLENEIKKWHKDLKDKIEK